MVRWFWKRWVCAAVAGVAVAAGSAGLAQPGKPGGEVAKPDDTLTIKTPGQPDRKVKVLKSTRKPDGTVETEVRDPASGETFTLIDQPGKADTSAPKDQAPPRPRLRLDDPLTPVGGGADRRIFGASKPAAPSNPVVPPGPAAAAATPTAPTDASPDTGKKPGLISRIFGPKKPAAGPAATAMPSAPAAPPSIAPKPIVTGKAPALSGASSGAEPPRVMPSIPVPPAPPTAKGSPARPDPVTPPTPQLFPSGPPVPLASPPPAAVKSPTPPPATPLPTIPMPIPTPPPVISTPVIPAPMPAPASPAIPAAPATPKLPTIPTVPGGQPQTIAPPAAPHVVQSAGFAPTEFAAMRDIQPHLKALTDEMSPSARLTAATALAQCRHASSDHVKTVLFQAAQADPCPAVRAACIEHLCRLGYFHPPFLDYLKAASTDPDAAVQAAAKAALLKMSPRQW